MFEKLTPKSWIQWNRKFKKRNPDTEESKDYFLEIKLFFGVALMSASLSTFVSRFTNDNVGNSILYLVAAIGAILFATGTISKIKKNKKK